MSNDSNPQGPPAGSPGDSTGAPGPVEIVVVVPPAEPAPTAEPTGADHGAGLDFGYSKIREIRNPDTERRDRDV